MGKLPPKYRKAEELIFNETEKRGFLDILHVDLKSAPLLRGNQRIILGVEALLDVMHEVLNASEDRDLPKCINALLRSSKTDYIRSLGSYDPTKRAKSKKFLTDLITKVLGPNADDWEVVGTSLVEIIKTELKSSTLPPEKKSKTKEQLELLQDIAIALGKVQRNL